MNPWFEKKDHFVYLVKSVFEGQQAIKVGHTWNVKVRMPALKRTYKLDKVTVLMYWKMPSKHEAFEVERQIIEQLSPFRIKGEWFKAEAFYV
jgi:hypothetical protein